MSDFPKPAPVAAAHVVAPIVSSSEGNDRSPAGGDTYEGVRPAPVKAGGVKLH